jgi:DNA-binding protein Fis
MSPEEENEYERLMKNRPHVVILGAGATMAAIPSGDKNGRKSSVMNGFIEALGMTEILKEVELQTSSHNLEDIYSELHNRPECDAIREELDRRIRAYFSELELPDEPNIYDLLLLALRKKDIVATFNWDPLLLQAYQRVCLVTKDLPDLAFLHGNVLVGYCRNHKCGGILTAYCRECGEPFVPAPLLYPVAHKNYAADPYIQDNWKAIQNKLKRAYLVTIFGYSAPKTDVEAIALMKNAWGSVEERELEDFEFIDIRDEDALISSWQEFVHSHHYRSHSDFFSSSLAQHPRRTTVEFFDRTMNCMFTKALRKFVPGMIWEDVESIVSELVEEEDELPTEGFLVTHEA